MTHNTFLFILFTSCTLIICFFLAWLVLRRGKHKEHMFMIQKDMNPYQSDKNQQSTFLGQKTGIVIIGIGVSLFLIALMVQLNWTGKSDAIYPAIILLCTGASIVLAQYLERKGK